MSKPVLIIDCKTQPISHQKMHISATCYALLFQSPTESFEGHTVYGPVLSIR